MSTLANHVIAQVIFDNDDGLPEDAVTNTFHFQKPSGTSFALASDAIETLLEAFFTVIPSGSTNKIAGYLSNALKSGTNSAHVKTYDGSIAPGSRIPRTYNFTWGPPVGSNDLPNETAVCLSFRNRLVGSTPFASQRGRVYIGPLCTTAITNGTAGPVPTTTMIGDLVAAGLVLARSTAVLGTGWAWCVYSQKLNVLTEVAQVYVDNALDTQRRRGPKYTARTFGDVV